MDRAAGSPLLLLLLLLPAPPNSADQVVPPAGGVGSSSASSSAFSRDDFPQGFVFGSGTSAYQVEGAVDEDGRTPSIWDTFTHAGMMDDGSTADVTADQYHKYREDVKLMKDIGMEAYRFSISWPRLIPNGRGAVNPRGVMYYSNLIDELLNHGIQPHVTLHHMDLPQAIEDEYHGWLSPRIVDDFTAFAEVCFREFGNRVAHWTTINELNILANAQYDNGEWPPCRCSYPFGVRNCTAGDSTVEPYLAAHNGLLAHASVVKLYRTKYQAVQGGSIGINAYAMAYYPFTSSAADVAAARRAYDFLTGWILEPLTSGDYPKIMRKLAGSRIPSFTKSQKELLRGAFDFFGINHYAYRYVADDPDHSSSQLSDYNTDVAAKFADSRNDTPGQATIPSYLHTDPVSLKNVLEHLMQAYGNPPVYVHENGYGSAHDSPLNDTDKIDVLKGYIGGVLAAIRNGSDTRGYFTWSFVDVFEFLTGYQRRNGFYHVDFEDKERSRRPKLSALWYKDFLTRKEQPPLSAY